MRPFAVVVLAALIAGCHRHAPPPQAQPTRVVTRDVITAVPLDSTSASRGTPPIPAAAFRNAMSSAEDASAVADTLVPLVDSLVLHVGAVFEFRPSQWIQARRADGSPVGDFAPILSSENSAVARFSRGGLLGVAVGRTRIIVRPLESGTASRSRARPASILVVVVP
jgi:hypothetical protein